MLRVSKLLVAEMNLPQMVSQVADATMTHPTNPTQTQEFKAWFGKSVVVDGSGRPKRVFHGSTHTFDRFTETGANAENMYGKAYYFTDDTQDVNENYARTNGPDLRNRIVQRVDEIMEELDDQLQMEEITPEEHEKLADLAEERAKKELTGDSQGHVYVTYLRIERPVYVQPSGGTYFPGAEYDSNDEDAEPRQSRIMSKLFAAFQKACSQYGVKYFSPVDDEAYFEGCSAYQFEEIVRGADETYDAEGGPGPLIATTYRLMGFDGIILDASAKLPNMKLSKGTHHYIVWNPRQVKSAIGNSGQYNRRSPRLVAKRV